MDVRDVAKGHVLALKKESAANHRIVVSGGLNEPDQWRMYSISVVCNTDIDSHHPVNISHQLCASLPPGGNLGEYGKARCSSRLFDILPAVDILGLEFTSMEQTVRDMLTQFKSEGWLS